MITFPPSPAQSCCDSLAGIEDLDAFLEAQGQLSHFPTPLISLETDVPSKALNVDSGNEVALFGPPPWQLADVDDGHVKPNQHIGRAMTHVASDVVFQSSIDAEHVVRILERAHLPPEVLAIAYNILCRLRQVQVSTSPLGKVPADLLVCGALILATLYTDDRPSSYSSWSRYVCDLMWTARRLDQVAMKIMAALDWRLLELCSPWAIQEAMTALHHRTGPQISVGQLNSKGPEIYMSAFELSRSPKLCATDSTSWWVNGQVTPSESPTSPACEGPFLRLL